jgi:hypothetical protein
VQNRCLYIIAGCNGAGKTTTSFNILPNILNCKEYVNADEIARGISPFQPEKVAIESGRIMLKRIDELILENKDFAFETTLSSKIFKNTIKKAKSEGYFTTLIFFWLETQELAIKRVLNRVQEGGHDIPENVIRRRYVAGIKNLFELYFELPHLLLIYDNSTSSPYLILEKEINQKEIIYDLSKINSIKSHLL